MTEEEVKKWLHKYLKLKLMVRSRRKRLQDMEDQELLPGKTDSTRGGTHGSSSSSMVATDRRIDYEDANTPIIQKAEAEMGAILNAVDALEDPMEREVLYLRYIDSEYYQPRRWPEVAERMYGDNDEAKMQAVFRLHRTAIKKIAAAADLSANVSECQ